jgi:hypothetical protein
MPKDAETAQNLAASIGMLKAKRVDVHEVKCDPFTVSTEFLVERVPGLTHASTPAMEKTQPGQRQQQSRATGACVSCYPRYALHLATGGSVVVLVPPG